MKQRITYEQLNELSQPQRQKLRKYLLGDWSEPMKVAHTGEMVTAQIPTEDYLLSIGQMIEFLSSYQTIIISCDDRTGFPHTWLACGYDRPELCDALWEAVKEVLSDA